ncbi:transcription factor MYB73-like [Brachypodium distachyon]|uniref:Uncharacterized protein n=1 Tax=Brachypodium distachyon TaxID=15368 RepID=A0A0Q3J7Z2_BRADI|nr:transcription factor MYB73-like [Brachypodium distachyon]KQK08628.1 hypothetical protein BRADI_2g42936v3 [Brachypodium distachyon]|eukprot:XP_024314259.1 transcription factor MYB73-like [Brachypodium distachyon]
MLIVRLRLRRGWTAEEDARLEKLATENRFRHWHRVARQMPGRSHKLCRDRWRDHLARDLYSRAFTAADDAELARQHRRHGGRWKDISRHVHARTTRVLKRRWKELLRKKNGAEKMEASTSPTLQHPLADVLAAGLSSCSLGGGPAGDPRLGSLALGFACMAV